MHPERLTSASNSRSMFNYRSRRVDSQAELSSFLPKVPYRRLDCYPSPPTCRFIPPPHFRQTAIRPLRTMAQITRYGITSTMSILRKLPTSTLSKQSYPTMPPLPSSESTPLPKPTQSTRISCLSPRIAVRLNPMHPNSFPTIEQFLHDHHYPFDSLFSIQSPHLYEQRTKLDLLDS